MHHPPQASEAGRPLASAPGGEASTSALQTATLSSATFSSIATDDRGVIRIFNTTAERLLGYAGADVLNRLTAADIAKPDALTAQARALSAELGVDVPPGFEALVYKAARGIEDVYDLTLVRKDGTPVPAIVSVTALRDGSGGILGYLFLSADDTGGRLTAPRPSPHRAPDAQHPPRSALLGDLPAGYTRDELVGAMLLKLTRPGSRIAAEACRSCHAARDITERTRLDEVLHEKTAELEGAKLIAETSNRAKSDFLSSMSHELRSPLNAILGFAQLLDSELPPPSKSQKGSIHQILHAGWYLLELINEVLDLAYIESGKLVLSEEPILLSDVLGECQAMMEQQADQHGIRLVFPANGPLFLRADRTRLKQVMINLLSNGIKYNTPGGSVFISVSTPRAGWVRIAVRDTGIGLSPRKQAQLFQPFNRLGQEGGVIEGTGIGLVMSKLLVELMGGTIGVDSEAGVGSTFWYELRSASAPETLSFEAERAEDDGFGVQEGAKMRTLLYVEDNPANLDLIEQLIQRRPDIRLLSARDGLQGIELARAQQPDVILMDINLPGITGMEALKILHRERETAHIPVVALSANAMRGDITNGLDSGFFRYLTKPIVVTELMSTLELAFAFAATSSPQVPRGTA